MVVGVEGGLGARDGGQIGEGEVKLGVPIVVVDGAADQFMGVRCSGKDLEIAGVEKLNVEVWGSRRRTGMDGEDLFWSHDDLEGGTLGTTWMSSCWP